MPITTSEIVEQRGNEARFRHVDHTGREYRQRWILAPGADINALLASSATRLENSFPQMEIEQQLQVAERGNDPDKVPPDHQTQADFDRRFIGRLMTVHDIDTLIAALSFWLAQELRNGANNNQRATNLGVPVAEYVEADARFGDLQGVAGGVATVNGQQWDGVKDGWL